MKPTKHATTNFKRLKPFINGLYNEDHRRYTAPGYMDLIVERLYDEDLATGTGVYSLSHYGEQNGDMMADPDMELRVNFSAGTVEPLTWQNDYIGRYDQVYIERNGQKLYSPRLRASLDDFLWHWLQNIEAQGFARSI